MALASVVNVIVVLIIFAIIFFANSIYATSTGSSGNANLTIYDDTESGTKYTVCTDSFCSQKNKPASNTWNTNFYANFTNSSGSIINSTFGNVNIRFNITGSWTNWENMTFNSSSLLWQFNSSSTYKGVLNFSVNATSNYGNLTLSDNISITNTVPYIIQAANGHIDFDGDGTSNTLSCSEDTLCIYNFSSNISDDDRNDLFTYNYTSSNTTLANFSLDGVTSILSINVTNDNNTGSKQIELNVRDSESTLRSAILDLSITAVNDVPQFINLGGNRTLNKSYFNLILQGSDEENDVPFTYNVSFMQCSHTAINPPTGTGNCTLFNLTSLNSTATNISFTPADNQKGEYKINFSAIDNRGAVYSQVVNWTLTWDDIPKFNYVCDNERNTTENSLFNCNIIANDTDELYNLTFIANYSWFKFNVSGTNSTTRNTTNGTATAIINFTASDSEVGNWSINITIKDTGGVNTTIEQNSTIIYFYVGNVNDSVIIDDIANITAFTSENYTIYFNASDSDLLIPDKSVYNESLTFTTNNSFVNITATNYLSGTNKTRATIAFNPNNLGVGNHTVNITVRDRYNYSISSDIFTIQVLGNNIPVWNSSTQTNHTLVENTVFTLNLSLNVSDADGNPINFSFSNSTAFNSFGIGTTTGLISFTPVDVDVGYHSIIINATDGITQVPLTFNFTVNNVNDAPVIQDFTTLSMGSANFSGNSSVGINVTEDVGVKLVLWVHDDDFRIPSVQRSFYDENLTINLTIQGQNTTLFYFITGGDFSGSIPQRKEYWAIFTPREEDIGNYNITLNISDQSNSSHTINFNFSVLGINDGPTITELGNIISSVVESIYINYNATDEEDKNETYAPGNFTFIITNLTAGGNFLNSSNFNSTSGVLNFTFNQGQAGIWAYNISVNDSSGLVDFEIINITVYDYPIISSPSISSQINMVENTSYRFSFIVNSTIGRILNNTLNYELFINGISRNSTSGNGNGTTFLWNFTSNFTDETTCMGVVNLTLNVSNAKLSNTTTWNLTVNHTNAPLSFISNIGDVTGGTPQSITLSSYFRDIDAQDGCVNQTIGFIANLISGSGITVSITNWTNGTTPSAQFSATSDSTANYSLIAFEYNGTDYPSSILSNITSNNFSMALTVTTTTTPTPSSGGGGGGSSTREKPVSLKIIVPEPVSSRKKDKLIVPLGIWNDGSIDLNDIVLSSIVAKAGVLRNDLIASFDRSTIQSLKAGERQNVTMIVDIDTTTDGIFEVTINATVKDPKYNDWGKFYIEVRKDDDIIEKIIFTEELIVGNPACTELRELVNEAKKLYASGDIQTTRKKLDEAVDACMKAITQPISQKKINRLQDNIFAYISIASILAFGVGIVYYQFRKIKLKRTVANEIKQQSN